MSPCRLARRVPTILAILGFWALPSMAQSSATTVSDINASGAKPFASLSGNDIEYVDVNNGGVNVKIPLVSKKGRGLDFNLNITYSSKFWNAINDPTYGGHMVIEDDGTGSVGWDTRFLDLTSSYATIVCYDPNNPDQYEQSFVFHDSDGAKHSFQNQTPVSCASGYPRDYSTDMMGLMLRTTQYVSPPTSPHTIYLPNGVMYKFKSFGVSPGFVYIPDIEDTNGNRITSNYVYTLPSGPDTETWTDSSGAIVAARTFNPRGSLASVSYTDSNGNLQNYTFTWTSTPVICNFQHPQPCLWTQGSIRVLSQITLPNGLSYRFGYNDTSGNPNPGGELMRIDLPSGGYVRYEYQTLPNGENSDGAGPADSRIVTKRVHSADGVHEDVWLYSYTRGTQKTTTVTDPLGNQEVYTFDYLNSYQNLLAFETRHQFFQGAATLVKQIDQTYQYDSLQPAPCGSSSSCGAGNVNHRVVSRTVTWPQANQVSQTTYAYDQFSFDRGTLSRGNVIQTQEYDYGSGSPGTLLRTTVTSPLTTNPVNSVDYTSDNLHIWRKPSSEVIHTGPANGTVIAQTQYEYDNYTESLTASSAIQHDTSFATGYTTRGNVTAIQRWRNTDGAWLTTRNQYDDAGNIRKTTDPLLHSTLFSLADSWGNSTCAPSSGNAAAYVTSVTDALGHIARQTYNSCTGTSASATDANIQTTSFNYDQMNRLTLTNFPDGGLTTNCYTDIGGATCSQAPAPFNVVTNKKVNTAISLTTMTLTDGLARVKQSQLTSDPQGTVYTDTTYDALGRVSTVSNPHRTCGTDITSSCGLTTYGYDALGQKTSETYPDNSVLTTAYCGPSTLVTDATGKWRRSRVDGLGHLVEVDEPNAPGASVNPNGCPGTSEPIWVTTYGYDTLGNLTSVLQNGSRQRNFTYDSLSRLLTSSNPETGTITYKCDSDTNCSSPNSFPTLLVSKTDARGIRTCSQYDALNRLTQKSYSDGITPSANFGYDQQAPWGWNLSNYIGRLTSESNGQAAAIFNYDPMGRVINYGQCTPLNCTSSLPAFHVVYTYDLAGNVTQILYYPSGRTINYTYDSANRPSTATDGSNGVTYATGFQTSPGGTCITNVTCYTPQGTVYALSVGQSSAFTNGLNLTHIYNSRLQPQEFKASSSGGNAIDISYGFIDPATSKNAGHVYSIINNLNSSRTQNFTYDQLNRIKTAGTAATTGPYCWGYDYSSSYDPWGNLQSQPGATVYTGCTEYLPPAMTADGNNHLSGFSYDVSGNTTNDGVNSYTWDAESQLSGSAGVTYTYDVRGRRVSKSTGKNYIYGMGDEILGETDASGNTTAEYVFFGGKRIAMSSPGQGFPGTGSATVSGSEQSIIGAPATSGTGSVTFSGSLQSKQVLSHAATSGTGSVGISGGPDQSTTITYVCGPNGQTCQRTVYDGGSVSVTVNGFTVSASYYQASTTATIATALASALNASGSPVTASAGGGGVTMTAKTTGAASNYPVSVSVSYDSNDFSHASFAASGPSALTGGANATYTTVYDSGTDTITVNGHADTVSWSGSGTTPSSIASALVSSINADSAASVSASASGAIVNLTAKTTGASTNYSLSSSSTYDSTDFTSPSFTSSNSGSALTGGHDPGATVYDSGNVWVTINGTQYSVSYGQGSSSSSIASGLASAISAGSLANATASGSSISITSKSNGAATNYSLSSGSSTSQGSFSSASFTTSTSGTALTGGSDGISYYVYYVEDLLGTSRVMTTNTGVVCYDADFYPYGGERPPYTNTCPQNYKFEGKERDTETGNDDFGARYYSNRFGRWLSADWSAVPVPVPYANLTNPQTLNLYAMVADDPESFADLDGHADDSISTIIQDAVLTAIGTWASDNILGALRPNPETFGGKMGQAIGDFAAQQSGIAEAEFGASLTPPALALAGGGQVEALAVPAGLVGHGTATAGIATINLAKDAAETSTSSKPHGNTAGDQPAELYEKSDANGNFEKHGVSQDASKRYSKKEVNGGEVKVTERGPRNEMLKKERQKVETNPGPKNKEPWAGKKKDANQQP